MKSDQRCKRSAVHFLILLVNIAIIVWLFGAQPAAACTPASIGWWYEEALTVDSTGLPPKLSVMSQTSDHRARLSINNNAVTPVYTLERADMPHGAVVYTPVELPTGWVANALVTSFDVQVLESMAVGLQDLNHFDTLNPTRPTNVKAPSPQRSQIMLVYIDQLVRIPLTLSYQINHDYHPEYANPCPSLWWPLGLLGYMPWLFPLFLVLTVIFAISLSWRKRS